MKSSNNLISSFILKIDNQYFSGIIDNDKNEIKIKLPIGKNLSNLVPIIKYNKYANIFPLDTESQNFNESITYTVIAENGEIKDYKILIEKIDLSSFTYNFSVSCDHYNNFHQWFGGDSRPEHAPRNVGAGVALRMNQDLVASNFSIYLSGPFDYDHTNVIYPLPVEVKLNIRNYDGIIIASQTAKVFPDFTGGWVDFNLSGLNLLLQKDTTYIFTAYVPNGHEIKANTGIRGGVNIDTTESEFCYQGAYSAIYSKENIIDFEKWESWYDKNSSGTSSVYFNFRLTGKK